MYRFLCPTTRQANKNQPANVQMCIDNSHNVGHYVTVLDRLGDNHYHLAKILTVDEHTTTVHYYVTYDTRLRTATWKPLYRAPHENQVVMRKPDTINRNHFQWTGTSDTNPAGQGHIILINIGMTSFMKIGSRSRKILTSMNNHTQHILTNTWMRLWV